MYHRRAMPARQTGQATNAVPDLLGVLAARQRQAQGECGTYLALVPNQDRMLFWLAKACKEARLAADRKLVHVAASANRDQSTLFRFEKGEGWPRETDQFIAAYADDLDIDPIQIWETAIQMWKADAASNPTVRLERDLESEARKSRGRGAGSAKAKRAAGDRPKAR